MYETPNKTMNFTKSFSIIGLSLFVFSALIGLNSCGSENDEPKYPDDSIASIDPASMLSPSILPGLWEIECIEDKATGEKVDLNQIVTIEDFKVQQKSDDITVKNDHQFWSEIYDKIVTYENDGKTEYTHIKIDFCKAVGADVKNSLITNVQFSYPLSSPDGLLTNIFYLADFEYSDGILTSKNSAYISTSLSGAHVHQIAGVLKMRKL